MKQLCTVIAGVERLSRKDSTLHPLLTTGRYGFVAGGAGWFRSRRELRVTLVVHTAPPRAGLPPPVDFAGLIAVSRAAPSTSSVSTATRLRTVRLFGTAGAGPS